MKGTTLGGLAVCSLIFLSANVAIASTPAPWTPPMHGARAPRANEIRFETQRHHLPGDEISLGADYYPPAPDTAPAEAPDVGRAPVYVPVEAAATETPSRGPRIIYVGKETERQKHGLTPQISPRARRPARKCFTATPGARAPYPATISSRANLRSDAA